MPRIVVLGDSHTQAIRQAAQAWTAADAELVPEVHWLASKKNGVARGDLDMDDAIRLVKGLGSGDLVVISLLGTAHNIFGLLQHERPFRLFEAGAASSVTDEAGEVIPRGALWDLFETWSASNKRLRQLGDASAAPVVHLMTPPPKEDTAFIRSKAKRYRERTAAEVDVASAPMRAGLWRLEMDVLAKVCRDWRIAVLPPPPQAVDDHGFLRREFYADDATHANAAYGELVLQQLAALASAGPQPSIP